MTDSSFSRNIVSYDGASPQNDPSIGKLAGIWANRGHACKVWWPGLPAANTRAFVRGKAGLTEVWVKRASGGWVGVTV